MNNSELAKVHWVDHVTWYAFPFNYSNSMTIYHLFWNENVDINAAVNTYKELITKYSIYENIPNDILQDFINKYYVVTPEEYETFFRKAIIKTEAIEIVESPDVIYYRYMLASTPNMLFNTNDTIIGGAYSVGTSMNMNTRTDHIMCMNLLLQPGVITGNE